MTPFSPTTFFYRHLFADITFTADADGHITGLTWKSASGEFSCRKVA